MGLSCILFIQDYIKPFVGTVGMVSQNSVLINIVGQRSVQDTVLVICVLKGQIIIMCCCQTAVSYQLWTTIKLCKIIITGKA